MSLKFDVLKGLALYRSLDLLVSDLTIHCKEEALVERGSADRSAHRPDPDTAIPGRAAHALHHYPPFSALFPSFSPVLTTTGSTDCCI